MPKQGNITLAKQWQHPWTNGAQLIGKGRIDVAKDIDGKWTRIIGEFAEPTIQIASRNYTVRDLTIVGGLDLPSLRGVGTGHGEIIRTAFLRGFESRGMHTGVKIGDESFNGNAADITFRKCYFRDVDVAVQLTTSQNVNIILDNCFFKNVGAMVRILGGGNVRLRDGYAIETETVYLVQADGTGFGAQNSNLWIDGLVFDQKQDFSPCLLDDQGAYGRNRRLQCRDVVFDPGQFKHPARKPLFHFRLPNKVDWQITESGGRYWPEDWQQQLTAQAAG